MNPKKTISYLWQDIIQHSVTKKGKCFKDARSSTIKNKKRRRLQYQYYFNENQIIYFSLREKEVMTLLTQHYTVSKTGRELGLSTRTIEFYVKNIRKKLCCETKKMLINLLINEQILENLTLNLKSNKV